MRDCSCSMPPSALRAGSQQDRPPETTSNAAASPVQSKSKRPGSHHRMCLCARQPQLVAVPASSHAELVSPRVMKGQRTRERARSGVDRTAKKERRAKGVKEGVAEGTNASAMIACATCRLSLLLSSCARRWAEAESPSGRVRHAHVARRPTASSPSQRHRSAQCSACPLCARAALLSALWLVACRKTGVNQTQHTAQEQWRSAEQQPCRDGRGEGHRGEGRGREWSMVDTMCRCTAVVVRCAALVRSVQSAGLLFFCAIRLTRRAFDCDATGTP
jgi:hypothetical protein